jgi:nitrogen regulatory protein PII
MKRVEAVFAPVHLDGVVERLRMIGVQGMTLSELRVPSSQPHHMNYRGVDVTNDFDWAVRIDVVTTDDYAEAIINAILLIVQKGKSPDGFICVAPIEEAIRIRTGETGADAL